MLSDQGQAVAQPALAEIMEKTVFDAQLGGDVELVSQLQYNGLPWLVSTSLLDFVVLRASHNLMLPLKPVL
jgi:hypothetical protein